MAQSEDISPPPLKRQRSVETNDETILTSTIPSRPITEHLAGQLRIYSWNVNGIQPFLQTSITSYFTSKHSKSSSSSGQCSHDSGGEAEPGPTLRGCLKRWKFPSIVCLQEVKIVKTDKHTQAAVRQAVRAPSSKSDRCLNNTTNPEPGYSAFFALPRDKYNARGFGGKVYGVCMLIREDLLEDESTSERLTQDMAWDLEGRVLKFELYSKMLVIFNVYAVNGTDNPYKDPTTGQISGTRHDRKRAMHSDLATSVRNYEDRGWHVIVAGDLNIARAPLDGFPGIRQATTHVDNRADFEKKFMLGRESGGLDMLDTFRALHGKEQKYSYRPRGVPWGSSCDRVDLILASRSVEQGLLEADILDDVVERGPSDHVPLYVTLDLDKLPALDGEQG